MQLPQTTIALLLALALPLTVGALGRAATAGAVATWYPTLNKPAWNPPSWVFAPLGTVLHVLMGLAAWLVWRAGAQEQAVQVALSLFAVQLVASLLWSLVFFRLRRPDLAFVEIIVLWGLILATLVAFTRVQPVAGLLLAPYHVWVTFATALNGAIWWLNR